MDFESIYCEWEYATESDLEFSFPTRFQNWESLGLYATQHWDENRLRSDSNLAGMAHTAVKMAPVIGLTPTNIPLAESVYQPPCIEGTPVNDGFH